MFGFIWVGLAAAVGFLAYTRGRSGLGWFALACLISPLLGFIFVLIAQDKSAAQAQAFCSASSRSHVRCPSCAEWVLPEASVCKHCHCILTPDTAFRSRLAATAKIEDQLNKKTIAITLVAIAGFVALATVVLSFKA